MYVTLEGIPRSGKTRVLSHIAKMGTEATGLIPQFTPHDAYLDSLSSNENIDEYLYRLRAADAPSYVGDNYIGSGSLLTSMIYMLHNKTNSPLHPELFKAIQSNPPLLHVCFVPDVSRSMRRAGIKGDKLPDIYDLKELARSYSESYNLIPRVIYIQPGFKVEEAAAQILDAVKHHTQKETPNAR